MAAVREAARRVPLVRRDAGCHDLGPALRSLWLDIAVFRALAPKACLASLWTSRCLMQSPAARRPGFVCFLFCHCANNAQRSGCPIEGNLASPPTRYPP